VIVVDRRMVCSYELIVLRVMKQSHRYIQSFGRQNKNSLQYRE